MPREPLILLFEPDPALAGALEFSLGLQGFRVVPGDPARDWPRSACAVIDQQQPDGEGIGLLEQLRAAGARGPAVILATNPPRRLRERAAAAGAVLVEKPLGGDCLPRTLHHLLDSSKAA